MTTHHPRARRVAAVTLACLTGSLVAAGPAGATSLATAGGVAPARPHGSAATSVLDWNAAAGRAAVAACLAPLDNPLHESRMYAMSHLAIHDALNAIDRRYRSYAADFTAPHGSSVRAAVAAAARDTLVSAVAEIPEPFAACRAAGIASVESDYVAALARVPAGRARERGLAVGQRAARAVIALRAGDGAGTTPLIVGDHPQGSAPGQWRFTIDRPFAFAPGWGSVRTFGLRSATQFPVAPPLRLTSAAYARDVAEAAALGGDGVATPTSRTPRQTETARFWLESSPLAWNRIARTVSRSAHLDAWEQARLFGLLGAALADGYVASFAAKYRYSFWRPETAIRAADTDGNPRTVGVPGWAPLETTPPIPDHDSAHAVQGAAAAAVLRQALGTDRFRFSLCSNTLPSGSCTDAAPTLHHFTRFSDAARENGDSRVWVGFHFRHAVDVGLDHGTEIGRWNALTMLRPMR